jgi:hypothetical protein
MMPVESNGGVVCITGPSIAVYRLIVLRSALRLEKLGMKRRGRSALAIVKEEFGLKGNRDSVYEQFDRIVNDAIAADQADNEVAVRQDAVPGSAWTGRD